MKASIIFLLLLVVTRPGELHKQFRLRRDDFGPAKSIKIHLKMFLFLPPPLVDSQGFAAHCAAYAGRKDQGFDLDARLREARVELGFF